MDVSAQKRLKGLGYDQNILMQILLNINYNQADKLQYTPANLSTLNI